MNERLLAIEEELAKLHNPDEIEVLLDSYWRPLI